tara:strand:+ start:1829 stop:2257 length:429 start_codon:yes stop_codon:yes gene_type:complete
MIISPERHIYLKLLTTPSVARTVGFDVYPIAVPKIGATLPFIIYKRANVLREPALSGPTFQPMVSVQIACWALSYDEVRELGDETRLALDGHTGTLAGCRIDDMRLTSEVDDFLDPTDTGAQLPPAYEVRQLYQVRWSEATE